jgi:hypothetical protein
MLPALSKPIHGLELPESVDLGVVQAGDIASGSFTVCNRTKNTASLWGFTSGCACIALSKLELGKPVALGRDSKVTLSPGEILEVRALMSVKASTSGTMRQVIRMATDVLGQSEVEVAFTAQVRYGVYPEPRELSLGELVPDAKVRSSILLVDARHPSRRDPLEARSTSPHVRVVRLDRVESPDGSDSINGCDHYRVSLEALVPHGGREEQVLGAIEILGAAGIPHSKIRFAGTVRQSVTLSPASLVLRRSVDGEEPSRTEAVCRSDDPCKLRLVSAPGGILT